MTSADQHEPTAPVSAAAGWRAWRPAAGDGPGGLAGEGLREWGHASGGTGLCLVQLDLSAGAVVLAEIAENPDRSAVALDPGGACDAVWHGIRELAGDGVDPLSITWILRTGPFSYPDAYDSPQEWSQIHPTLDGDRLRATLGQIRLLGAPEVSRAVPHWIRDRDVAHAAQDLVG